MNIEELRNYCISLEGVTEKTPFGKFAQRYESILVFYIMDHMFCFADMDDFTSVTVKSTIEEIEKLQMNHLSVTQPINRALKTWIQVDINKDITDREIYALVMKSYNIVKTKYSRKK